MIEFIFIFFRPTHIISFFLNGFPTVVDYLTSYTGYLVYLVLILLWTKLMFFSSRRKSYFPLLISGVILLVSLLPTDWFYSSFLDYFNIFGIFSFPMSVLTSYANPLIFHIIFEKTYILIANTNETPFSTWLYVNYRIPCICISVALFAVCILGLLSATFQQPHKAHNP